MKHTIGEMIDAALPQLEAEGFDTQEGFAVLKYSDGKIAIVSLQYAAELVKQKE
jgi:hypothetical protein